MLPALEAWDDGAQRFDPGSPRTSWFNIKRFGLLAAFAYPFLPANE